MAGHSKWANIKHKKERADKKKGKVFSRLAKEIISAVKQGGPDPKANPKLKLILQKAKENNLPNDVIERNIKKASAANAQDYFEMNYELYGHGGVGIIADILTDNKNRIASEIRIATNKCGGTIAAPGSVAFNFERKGVIQVLKKNAVEDELFLIAFEAGAEDFEEEDDIYIITMSFDDLNKIKETLEQNNIPIEEASLDMLPKVYVDCTSEDEKKNLALIDWLENIDDVDVVYHNMKIS